MKKLIFLLALVLSPTLAFAALLEGMVEKVDKNKMQIVLKTDKGQEIVEYNNATKGVEKANTGAKVQVTYDRKAEKLMASEIADVGAGSPQNLGRGKAGYPDHLKEKTPPAVK